MADSDEFAEFETDEATFDAMLEEAEPAQLVPPPTRVTLLSPAQDVITFARGLPVSINSASSVAAWESHLNSIRVQPIRQGRHAQGVAG